MIDEAGEHVGVATILTMVKRKFLAEPQSTQEKV
jgi:hypothetical protein